MSISSVPISEASYQILKNLAELTGQSISQVLENALKVYRQKAFFESMNAGYAELQADPEAWAEHEAERKLWETTLMDGLGSDERWTEDGRCNTPEEGKP
jgi:hypothetical protein